MPAVYPAFFFVLEKAVKSVGNAVTPTYPMHRSHGLQGSLKRRYKHPSPTSINGYHTAKKLLSQSPAKRPTFAFTSESEYTRLSEKDRTQRHTRRNRGLPDGAAITTLGAFRTFTNIPGPGIRTAYFAAFGSWSETLPKNAESLRSSDALTRVAAPRRRGPAGLRCSVCNLVMLLFFHSVRSTF